jgi:hypothetical protein
VAATHGCEYKTGAHVEHARWAREARLCSVWSFTMRGQVLSAPRRLGRIWICRPPVPVAVPGPGGLWGRKGGTGIPGCDCGLRMTQRAAARNRLAPLSFCSRYRFENC